MVRSVPDLLQGASDNLRRGDDEIRSFPSARFLRVGLILDRTQRLRRAEAIWSNLERDEEKWILVFRPHPALTL
jgi:hypothetical protein